VARRERRRFGFVPHDERIPEVQCGDHPDLRREVEAGDGRR